MRPTYVWAAVVALVAVLAAITVLILQGHDPAPLIQFLVGVPATVAAAVAAIRIRAVDSKVDTVSRNVNGHLSRLADAAGIPKPRGSADDAPEAKP